MGVGMRIEALRKLCALYWNPIGIPMSNIASESETEFPALPEDEYDAYLSNLGEMIERHDSVQEMLEYLSIVERDYIMLSAPSGDKRKFLEEVLKEAKA